MTTSMYDVLGSLVRSFLDTVSDVVDVARLSDKHSPAAPPESRPLEDVAICFPPVPGGDSWWSAALPGLLEPVLVREHLLLLTQSLTHLSIPVPLV